MLAAEQSAEVAEEDQDHRPLGPEIAEPPQLPGRVGKLQVSQLPEIRHEKVAEILELSLPALRDGYQRGRLVRRGLPIRTDTYVVDGQVIWGATARILSDLFNRIDGLLGGD